METKSEIKTTFHDGTKNRWNSDHYAGAEKIAYSFGQSLHKIDDESNRPFNTYVSQFKESKGILGKLKYVCSLKSAQLMFGSFFCSSPYSIW